MAETFQAAVERLKSKENAKAFGLHSPEDQEIFERAGSENTLLWTAKCNWIGREPDCNFNAALTYAIAEDYQPGPPKPKTDDVPVIYSSIDRRLGASVPRQGFVPLHELPSLPGFRGFLYLMGKGQYGVVADIELVAQYIANGKEIIALMEAQV